MPKRGEKATHRVRFVHANDISGTIPASSLEAARYAARERLRVEGCTVTIEEITGRGGQVIETYTNPDDLQAALDDADHHRAVHALASARSRHAPPTTVAAAETAVAATLTRGPGRPPKEGGRRIHINLNGDRLAAVDAAWAAAKRDNPKTTRTDVIETLIDAGLAARQETTP